MTIYHREEEKLQAVSAFIRSGCKQEGSLKIGVEMEHFLLEKDSGRRVFYGGEKGVGAVLDELAALPQAQPVLEGDHMLGVIFPEGTVSIEPGAQFEISLENSASLPILEGEYQALLRRIQPILNRRGLALTLLGLDPHNRLDDIPLIPRDRYRIMDQWFLDHGQLSRTMMRQTCSLQFSVDYTDEADFILKARLLNCLVPILYSLFDHSPRFEGEAVSGYNFRQRVWEKTDPARTGLLPGLFSPGFSMDSYSRWLLSVPLLFLPQADGTAREVGGMTLSRALDQAGDEEEASRWIQHAFSIVFPDIRVKQYLEIRPMDAVSPALAWGAAALVKGLVYQPEALARLNTLFEGISEGDIEAGKREGLERGIHGLYCGRSYDQWGLLLAGLAKRGLDEEEAKKLAPLKALWEEGMTPRLAFEKKEREEGLKSALRACLLPPFEEREG